jgi:hypothetical protein
MIPNTGSGVCLRRAYCCLPFGVRRRHKPLYISHKPRFGIFCCSQIHFSTFC